MKNVLLLFTFCFSSFLIGQQTESKIILGTITDGRSPVDNVTISISNKATNTVSDSNGKYQIQAQTGDVISYSYQGLKTVRIRVEDVTRILNITMIPDVQELEEVTVVGSNRKTQKQLEMEYPTNQNIIKTAYGFLNAETAPGKIRFLDEDEMNSVAVCILDLLQNQFAGIRVQGNCLGAFGPGAGGAQQLSNLAGGNSNQAGVVGLAADANGGQSSLINGKVFIRGNSSLFNSRSAIFDVDGQIFTDAPIWIDIRNIKRLAILNNFATTTQYGSQAAGGVIVINTVNGLPQNAEIFDRARLRNNYVADNILSQEQVLKSAPSYYKELYASSSLEDAMAKFKEYSKTYSSLPFFYIDAQHYFENTWGETDFADEIVENSFGAIEKNPVLLKALAYQYESQGQFVKAHELYKKVLQKRPQYAQSYLDMANSFRNLKQVKNAADIYNRYSYLVEEGFISSDSSDFSTQFDREFNNLLYLNKASLVSAPNSNDLFIADEDFKGTRLVFEWNNSEAEFDLQFVNPEKQYTLFKHSLADNDELIANEKELGYSTKEFLIDDSLPGVWTVNVTYYGNKSLTPTYLKATVYQNYGTRMQSKEIMVYKLLLKNAPQKLFTVAAPSKLVVR